MGVTYDRKEGTAPAWDNLLLRNHRSQTISCGSSGFPASAEERRIGEQIIGNLDQNGYLVATTEEIAVRKKWSRLLWKRR